MIDYNKILSRARKKYSWIKIIEFESFPSFISEESLSVYLQDYQNYFFNVIDFLERKSPEFLEVLSFSDYASKFEMRRNKRLECFIIKMDLKTNSVNKALPLIKSIPRGLTAKVVAEWASMVVLGRVNAPDTQEKGVKKLVELVYNYRG